MSDFSIFQGAVKRQFDEISKGPLFRVDIPGDELWEHYLDSFPAGSNEVFRERREHDCSCCKNFIRSAGNVVGIVGGELVTIWDNLPQHSTYAIVSAKMAEKVKAATIVNVFLSEERSIGTEQNLEDDDGKILTWNHFHVEIPVRRNVGETHHCSKGDKDSILGKYRETYDLMVRAVGEIKMDAVDTVLELIDQGSLYRGAENKRVVKAFKDLKEEAEKLEGVHRSLFFWSNVKVIDGAVSGVRNSSIGNLLTNLSEGMELEVAVGKFEKMVAPDNYKRPTALVTPRMVAAAKEDIEKLGLTSALDRRYARLTDISVNDVAYVDRQETRKMRSGDVFAQVETKKTAPKNLSKVETISIEKFMSDVVPNVNSIEVLLENRLAGNLVSLIAPADPKAAPLFKWSNGFSWSYNGDVADSIKEKVKRAGGNVTGDLCCRLAWFNYDDLDFHMVEPGKRSHYEIMYTNKTRLSPCGGMLDVDMNAGSGDTREPVENIFYRDRKDMIEGVYALSVVQFARRESDNIGFEVEVDCLGETFRISYDKMVRHSQRVEVAKIRYTHRDGFRIVESLPSSVTSRNVWGLATNDYHKVSVIMKSPNHWDGETGIGNKHYFFMLDGCVNDGEARGIYNEFLKKELDKHRKVLEIVGSKVKAEKTDDQLSGLGFSETGKGELLVRVSGNFTRTLKITF